MPHKVTAVIIKPESVTRSSEISAEYKHLQTTIASYCYVRRVDVTPDFILWYHPSSGGPTMYIRQAAVYSEA